jgi:AsmA family protein
MDATKDDPRTRLDLKFTDLHLEALAPADRDAPIEGPLSVHISLTGGRGTSLHQVAASANGSVTAFLPQGALRSSLAELTGIDLRVIGLLLSKSEKQTVIRCGIAKFQATDGVLAAQDLMLDTESLLIMGTGTLQMKSEALELQLHGSPKHLRIFRLQSPLRVHGTLLHPVVSLEKPPSLKVVDLGKAADADCEPPAAR